MSDCLLDVPASAPTTEGRRGVVSEINFKQIRSTVQMYRKADVKPWADLRHSDGAMHAQVSAIG
jgi:hypothetical protein